MSLSKYPFFSQSPWEKNENAIWLATSLNLFRNIDKYHFPSKLQMDKRKLVCELLSKELLESPTLQHPAFLKGEEASPFEKQFLFEHFLTMHSFQQAHAGEGFIFDETKQFLATINLRNHLQLELLDFNGEIESSWSKLNKIEVPIGKTLSYAFSTKFGFLTSEPTESGTALIVSFFLQIPSLIHSEALSEFLVKHRDDSIAVTGIQGKPNEIIGDLVSVHNNYTLGVTEDNILSSLRSMTTKLIVEEKSIRSRLKEKENEEFKDKVSRAFGTLMYSYKIETVEAMNALSLLKLGLELGWVKGSTNRELNALFFNCRRGHLMNKYEQEIPKEEVPHKRAEFIHKNLKEIQLVI